MKNLWAPWRMSYIEGLTRKNEEKSCLFCRVISVSPDYDEENLVVYRGEKTFVMLNKYPYNNGHLMVVPKRHVPSIEDLNDDELLELAKTINLMIRALKIAYNPDAFNIGANIGRDAGAGIEEHFHVHVVPRWRGDTNFMPVIADTKVIPQLLQDSYKSIKNVLSKLL
ncbi:MAG: HIT domain-containing protein [Fervidicoccaceae archaeon]|nr:HIT domain-containing protein [Fervidicoccaceae archaeon]MCC6051617.1 HIT domain-containing protein [Fervidicoccaceae archaeon]